MQNYKDFVKETLDTSKSEPFCPFVTAGYCSIGPTEQCYYCDASKKAYISETAKDFLDKIDHEIDSNEFFGLENSENTKFMKELREFIIFLVGPEN